MQMGEQDQGEETSAGRWALKLVFLESAFRIALYLFIYSHPEG